MIQTWDILRLKSSKSFLFYKISHDSNKSQDHGSHVLPVTIHMPQTHVLRVRARTRGTRDNDALGLQLQAASRYSS